MLNGWGVSLIFKSALSSRKAAARERRRSGWLEEVIAEKMDELKVPIPTQIDPPKERPKAKSGDEIISQHFTF